MPHTTRRDFLTKTAIAGLGLGLSRSTRGATTARPQGANDAVRLAVIGMGATEAVGGVGGRGHQLLGKLREVPGARVVALCDVDPTFLEREAKAFRDRGETVALHQDLRRVCEDPTIDAVVIALPNHWHALATIWACQAGKDVYVEKPFSHDLWEGRQMVAAARKFGRVVQVGTQNRSSLLLRRVFAELRGGALGRIRFAHAIMYRPREAIGRVTAPQPPPAGIDYDLWCGPAPKAPLRRKQLHYEWHWFWDTGNGELGNNGVHMMDLCRWAVGRSDLPKRALSIGGRFAFDDAAETANTQIAYLDFPEVPLICEIRNVRRNRDAAALGSLRGRSRGLIIDCEGGYFAGDANGGALFDPKGKKIRDLPDDGSARQMEVMHLSNFVAAMRSRKIGELAAEAQEGHLSAAGCHLANLSHRLGRQVRPEAIREAVRSQPELADAFERCHEHLRANGVDLGATPATFGPWVTYDAARHQCVGEFAEAANRMLHRVDRAPFVVPTIE
ncbi:MAG: Gfo/Idh/MocA family oxidoreductase [Verrucomicrobia bacterium]|nr:Gfo/Idh/MocA family oxidoreductase [Verrucomicrobiota bacterium]